MATGQVKMSAATGDHEQAFAEAQSSLWARRIGHGCARNCNLKGQNTSCKDLAWEASCPCGVTGSGKSWQKRKQRQTTTDDSRQKTTSWVNSERKHLIPNTLT